MSPNTLLATFKISSRDQDGDAREPVWYKSNFICSKLTGNDFFLNEEEGKRNSKNCVNGVSFLLNPNILAGKHNYLLHSTCKFVVCLYETSA